MTEEVQYKCFKVFGGVLDENVQKRLQWCKQNNISVVNKTISGVEFAGQFYTEEDLAKDEHAYLPNGKKFWLGKLAKRSIGMVFCFEHGKDAMRFKLTWC